MRINIKPTVLALSIVVLGAQLAVADTYIMPIKGGDSILKVYLDAGSARRIGYDDGAVIFEVEVRDGACPGSVRLAFTDATNLSVPYDVCSETGFGLTKVYR